SRSTTTRGKAWRVGRTRLTGDLEVPPTPPSGGGRTMGAFPTAKEAFDAGTGKWWDGRPARRRAPDLARPSRTLSDERLAAPPTSPPFAGSARGPALRSPPR